MKEFLALARLTKSLQDSTEKPGSIRVANVKTPVINYEGIKGRNNDWSIPAYDLSKIDVFSDVELYVARAFEKKIGLFMKEGYDIVGEKPELVDYIKKRLAQIAYVSKTNENHLIRNIALNLIMYSNCWLAVVRKEEASGGYPYKDPRTGKKKLPIAAIFTIPAPTVEYKSDDDNHPTMWRQYVPETKKIWREYPLDSILHFYINKRDGQVVGTPRLISVMEDIKALRRIEENVEILISQDIFPIIHYRVGTPDSPARVNPNGVDEISAVVEQINRQPPEGVYVTPERHELKMIGTEGRALRVENYIQHWKNRVLAGLSLSSVDVGEGGTANRNTADTMSRSLVDEIKSDQEYFEAMFKELLIDPLLQEAGRTVDLHDPSDQVYIKFREIDYDTKIKRENHLTQLWLNSGITHSEFRRELGYNEMSEEEWQGVFFNKITMAQQLTMGASDLASPIAYTAASGDGPVSTSDINKASQYTKQREKAAAAARPAAAQGEEGSGTVENRNRPANQHGKKTSSAKSLKDRSLYDSEIDSIIVGISAYTPETFRSRRYQIIDMVKRAETSARESMKLSIQERFRQGLLDSGAGFDSLLDYEVMTASRLPKMEIDKYTGKLFGEILDFASTADSPEEAISRIDAVHYRLKLIDRTEGIRAYNWGVIQGLKYQKISEYRINMMEDTDEVEIEKSKMLHNVSEASFRSIPPWHPNSTIRVERPRQ